MTAAQRRWLLLAPAVAILACVAAGPLLVMLVYSFLEPGEFGGVRPAFSLDAWFSVLFARDMFDPEIVEPNIAHLAILWRSVSLALQTTLVCIVLGFPTAWFIATRPRGTRELWLFLVTIPFWTNLLVRTFAIQEVIRNRGLVNTLLMQAGVIDEPIQMLYTDFAVLVGMAYVFLPLMVLPLYAAMERVDRRLLEAARDLYASRWRMFREVVLPLSRPGLVAGSVLVFIPAIGAWVTPRLLGGGRNLMLGNLIELQFGQGRNWPLGAALSMTLLALVLVALLVYLRAVDPDTRRRDHG